MIFFESLKEYKNMTPGLSRIKKFFEGMGNPHDTIKVIHIAGTNGKGSTAAFISEILKAGGYKTALYTSPHLIDVKERIKISGENIPSRVFYNLSHKYLDKAVKCGLSCFEYLTAIAFIYFVEQKVDVAVIETGLGGRFDATNIIKNPLVCVITSVAKEHQEILGNTIERIAFEKVGIIKKSAYVVCGGLPKAAIAVVKNKVKTSYLYGKDFKALINKSSILGQNFDYTSENIKLKNIEINLLGEHQVANASVAVCVVDLLSKKEYALDETNIRMGLRNTVWSGRFDVRKVNFGDESFEIIIDGAHNVQGFNAFLKTFKQLGFSKKKRTFIFAVMKEKKYKVIVEKISPFAKKIILPKIHNDRAASPDVLKTEFSKYIIKNKIYSVDSVKSALSMINTGETAIVIGSLYLAGEVLTIIQ
ncbi:MAG: bifunctional folylpolyglutamate synthase/dihydrofolate synthase [Endomicrobium sp.]|uniref:bifunctional folylpolyglutamate synthase/dihydrofolate synthase n=1 Tax=Candidatus Endomicrobiellum pyrsonymphae TaxID=1408203 RepID=UPI0035743326|nr:bifunctional folylpolyglutamate synthase/dihydrofolate synthase [Endomicrobium sp.]